MDTRVISRSALIFDRKEKFIFLSLLFYTFPHYYMHFHILFHLLFLLLTRPILWFSSSFSSSSAFLLLYFHHNFFLSFLHFFKHTPDQLFTSESVRTRTKSAAWCDLRSLTSAQSSQRREHQQHAFCFVIVTVAQSSKGKIASCHLLARKPNTNMRILVLTLRLTQKRDQEILKRSSFSRSKRFPIPLYIQYIQHDTIRTMRVLAK